MSSPARVDPANDGKLIHVTGEATTKETLKDPLLRPLGQCHPPPQAWSQMYQWKETKESSTRKKLGGGTETVTTYKYDRNWADNPIESSKFHQPDGHHNPSDWPFASWTGQAQSVTLGAFALSTGLVGQIGGHDALTARQGRVRRPPRGASRPT